jgi:hypothetical protein
VHEERRRVLRLVYVSEPKEAEHSPAAVQQLALTEAIDIEHLSVRLEGAVRSVVNNLEAADRVTSFVGIPVLVELVKFHLHELGGGGEVERVEPGSKLHITEKS